MKNRSSGSAPKHRAPRTTAVLRTKSGNDVLLGQHQQQHHHQQQQHHHPTAPISLSTSTSSLNRQKSNDLRFMRQLYLKSAYSFGYHNEIHQVKPPATWQIMAGMCMMVGMMVLIMGIDFQKVSSSTSTTSNNNLRTALDTGNDSFFPPSQCRYTGECPIGTSCAIKPFSSSDGRSTAASLPGICEVIDVLHSPKITTTTTDAASRRTTECLQSCQKELEWDEYYYYHQQTAPVIQRKLSIESQGRPKGCAIVFKRKIVKNPKLQETIDDMNQLPKQNTWDWENAVQHWVEHRYTHIVRVDPVVQGLGEQQPSNSNNNNKSNYENEEWMAYCMNPCESDKDCSTENSNHGFVCSTNNNNNNKNENENAQASTSSNTCTRHGPYWKTKDHGAGIYHPHMTVVTAASSTYFDALHNLVASIHYWSPNTEIIVYHLGGWTAQQLSTALKWDNVSVRWQQDGIPVQYPKHVFELNKYAWKPIILNETVHEFQSVLWLDAGSTIMGPLTPVQNILQKTGLFLVQNEDDGKQEKKASLEATYKWFETTKSAYKDKPTFATHTQGYVYPSRYIETILTPMVECALDTKCIAPETTTVKHDHQFDQTALSILAHRSQVPHYTEYVAAATDGITEHNKLQVVPFVEDEGPQPPSPRFIWVSRNVVSWYAKYEEKMQQEEKEKQQKQKGDEEGDEEGETNKQEEKE